MYVYFILLCFLMFIYYWEKERERTRACEQGRNRGRDRGCEMGCARTAREPDAGFEPTTVRSRPEPKPRARCLTKWATQAPRTCMFNRKFCVLSGNPKPRGYLVIFGDSSGRHNLATSGRGHDADAQTAPTTEHRLAPNVKCTKSRSCT